MCEMYQILLKYGKNMQVCKNSVEFKRCEMKQNSVQFTSTWGRTMPPSPLALASVISRDTAHSSCRAGIGAEANKDPNILEQVPIHLVHTDATISLPKLGRYLEGG